MTKLCIALAAVLLAQEPGMTWATSRQQCLRQCNGQIRASRRAILQACLAGTSCAPPDDVCTFNSATRRCEGGVAVGFKNLAEFLR